MPTNSQHPALRYLTSAKNLAGMLVALLVIIGHITIGLGALWPLVAVAGYGVAALVAPSPKPLEITFDPTLAVESLRGQLRRHHDRLTNPAQQASPEIVSEAHELAASLDEVLVQHEVLRAAPRQAYLVEQIITLYLPQLIDQYLEIPPRARGRAGGDGVSANDAALKNLQLLTAESHRINKAVLSDSISDLSVHGNFLAEKFGMIAGPETEPDDRDESGPPSLRL